MGFAGEVRWRAEAALRLGAHQRLPSTLRRPWVVRCPVRAHHSAASHVQGNSVSRRRLLIFFLAVFCAGRAWEVGKERVEGILPVVLVEITPFGGKIELAIVPRRGRLGLFALRKPTPPLSGGGTGGYCVAVLSIVVVKTHKYALFLESVL